MNVMKNVITYFLEYSNSFRMTDTEFCQEFIRQGEDYEAFVVPRLRSSVDFHDYDPPFVLKVKHLGCILDNFRG